MCCHKVFLACCLEAQIGQQIRGIQVIFVKYKHKYKFKLHYLRDGKYKHKFKKKEQRKEPAK